MTTLPPRLRDDGATDFERLLLNSASEERPASELSHRMLVGLSAAAALGASSSAAAGTTSGLQVSALLKWTLSGALALGLGLGALSLRNGSEEPLEPAATQKPEIASANAQRSEPPTPQEQTESDPVQDAAPPATPSAPIEQNKLRANTQPSPAPDATPPDSDSPSLRQELLLLDEARGAVQESRFDAALRLLGVYKSRYPSGVLRQEATMLEVKVRRAQGDIKAAAALEADFTRRHPQSAHRSQDLAPLPAPSE